jgi:hypothetical protein
VILQTVGLEEKEGGFVSSFVSTVGSHHISGDMTGTDNNRTEIDSWLLVSFCYANSVVLHLFLANCGKVEENVSVFGPAVGLVWGNINKIKKSARRESWGECRISALPADRRHV